MTESGLRDKVFKDQYKDLMGLPAGFRLHLRGDAVAPRISSASATNSIQDHLAEGVRYIEVRFAPQLHINDQPRP
jgi:adenosine deaminase